MAATVEAVNWVRSLVLAPGALSFAQGMLVGILCCHRVDKLGDAGKEEPRPSSIGGEEKDSRGDWDIVTSV